MTYLCISRDSKENMYYFAKQHEIDLCDCHVLCPLKVLKLILDINFVLQSINVTLKRSFVRFIKSSCKTYYSFLF
jgi:hypothetical protein